MKEISVSELERNKENVVLQMNNLYSATNLTDNEDRKRTSNYYQWISQKTKMIVDEGDFKCEEEVNLKRGTVVWVDFGFNIGSEFGGRHPAIILRKTGSSVFVVPLSSQEPNEKKDYHVRVDKVYGFTNMIRWTNVLKLQNVSIQRIDFKGSIGNVKGKILDQINEALEKSYIF